MKHAWRLSILAFPTLAAALAFAGCSGDESVAFNGVDGSADGTVSEGGDGSAQDGAAEGGGLDGGASCPAYGGTNAYCRALAAYCTKCPSTQVACEVSTLACEQASSVWSADGMKAVVECVDKAACDVNAAASRKCVDLRLANGTPTAEQQKLAQDFCDACPGASGASCAGDFFVTEAGAPGPGVGLLQFNAAVITAIDKECVALIRPDAGDGGSVPGCTTKFAVCAAAVIAKLTPPDACKNGG